MRIRQRKAWKQRERHAAQIADPSTNLDPVVGLIVSLFPSSAMPNNRIAHADRTGTDHLSGSGRCPILRGLVRRWDKENRTQWRLSR
jgi:hypothetical protein